MLAIAFSALVLSTLISTPLLFSFELMVLTNRLRLFDKTKAVMRIQ
jgi:hypothetical protein